MICPTGHLGTTPLEKASFELGCAAKPGLHHRRLRQRRHRPLSARRRHSRPARRCGSARPRGHAARSRETRRSDDHRLRPTPAPTAASIPTCASSATRREAQAAAVQARPTTIPRSPRMAAPARCAAATRSPAGRTPTRPCSRDRSRGRGDGRGPACKRWPGRRRHHRRTLQRLRRSSPRPRSMPAFRSRQLLLGKVMECASFCAEPYGARRRCSAASPMTTCASPRCIRTSAAPSRRSPATRCTSARTVPRVRGGRLSRHVRLPLRAGR